MDKKREHKSKGSDTPATQVETVDTLKRKSVSLGVVLAIVGSACTAQTLLLGYTLKQVSATQKTVSEMQESDKHALEEAKTELDKKVNEARETFGREIAAAKDAWTRDLLAFSRSVRDPVLTDYASTHLAGEPPTR